ncbi:MAG: T9SS type A sorting domain-containing protein, partial [Flavobacteriaceae bacterium]|nr:T9SS type A sorting domain-containing protein [Flavobacteriaceae bacterium]
GTYSFNFGPDTTATPQLLFPNDTWIRVGFSFNQTTGEVKWKGPGLNGFIAGAAAGLIPSEIDFLVTNVAGNTVAASAFIDNYVARASSTDTLLEVETITRSVVVSTYPNPTIDIINVYNSNNLELSNYNLIDLKGTVIKSGVLNNTLDQKINVSELSQGVYMLKLNTTDNSTITKKIIKN